MYMYSNDIDFSVITELGIIFIFFAIVLGIISIILSVFGALGIMEVAKKNKMPNPWLAFIPVANSYLVGKIGFEVYSDESNKNTTFPWVMLGLSAGMIIVGDESDVYNLLSIALLVFSTMSYYRIYKYLTPKYKMYTVLSIFFGGIPLYFSREKIVAKSEPVVSINEVTNNNQTTQTPEGNLKVKFCSSCGKQLSENDKFCTNCGNKIM